MADVLVLVGHLDEAVALEASEGVEGVGAVVEHGGVDGWGLDGGGEAGERLNGQALGSSGTALLVGAVGAIVHAVAPARNVGAGVVRAAELDVGDERIAALLGAHHGWHSPRSIAAHLVGAVAALGDSVAATVGVDALV